MLIELSRGETIRQPMLNKIVKRENLEKALSDSSAIKSQLIDRGFTVNRTKIEVPALDYEEFQNLKSIKGCYFEWHGRIQYYQVPMLESLCEKYSVHLSRNALKNDLLNRFITLREYGSYALFNKRLKELKMALKIGKWRIMKEQAEYCIFDDKVSLDKGWLTK